MESVVDWRSQLSSDTRQNVLTKIIDTLKKHFHISQGQVSDDKLRDIALRFEDKTYSFATSQSDYARKISLKLLSLENRSSANPIPNSLPSTSDSGSQMIQQVNDQGQPPSVPLPCTHPQAGKTILPPVSGISQLSTPNMTGQSSSWQNIQNISVGNNMVHGIPSGNYVNQNQRQHYLYQQQHQNLLQPTMFQPSSLSTVIQNQQMIVPQSGQPVSQQSVVRQQRQQPNATNLQHDQLIGQPRNVQQQHLGQKQQQLHGTQSGNCTMLNNQHSRNMLQPTQGQRAQMPQLQTQSGQFQNPINIKQELPTSSAFQSQNVIDPSKQLFQQQQRAMTEAALTPTGNPNGGDWQEEVYQKLKAMKDKYMPYLNNMYKKVMAILQQPQTNEQLEKMKRLKQILEHYVSILHVPKSNISPKLKDNLDSYEIQIVKFISQDKRKPGTTINNPPHQSQQTQANENQLNSQNNNIVNLNHNSVSNTEQNITSMLQPNSNTFPQQQSQKLQHNQVHQQLPHKQNLPHQQTKHQQQNGQLIIVKSQVDHQNILISATKSGRPLQFGNSPSPSTPSTSHMPGDTEKFNSGVSSFSNGAMLRTQPLAIGTPSISTSPLLAESATLDGNHENGASLVSGNSSSIEDPMEHLLKVVNSISQKSLSASVSDIGSVVSMMDSVAGPTPGYGSRAVVGEDLVAMTKSCLQERTFVTYDGTRIMKRLASQMPLNVVSSPSSVNDRYMYFNCVEASELESTATSAIKRRRIEARNPLFEEIREINQGLIDTVVKISAEDASPFSEIGKGTVVTFSFSAPALEPNLKSQYASSQMSSIQPLRLLVPTNYPTCSPLLVDEFPLEARDYEDLSIKAKLRFQRCVRRLSDPMSLEEMARTWDVCARAVILEYSQQIGGGSFTTKYGAWKDCLTVT